MEDFHHFRLEPGVGDLDRIVPGHEGVSDPGEKIGYGIRD